MMGPQAISKGLAANTTLMLLNLKANRIGDSGGRAIIKALTVNTTLKKLSLQNNQLSEEGKQATVEAQETKKNKARLILYSRYERQEEANNADAKVKN